MYAESTSSISTSGRYTSLRVLWKHTAWTPIRGQQKKQHEVLYKRLKAKKVVLHTILLGVGGSIHTSHTLNHLGELGLDAHKTHKTALKLQLVVLEAHSVMHTNWKQLDSLLKIQLLSRSWFGAGGCLSPSRSLLALPFPWWSLTALWANVSPFPYLMWGVVLLQSHFLNEGLILVILVPCLSPKAVQFLWSGHTSRRRATCDGKSTVHPPRDLSFRGSTSMEAFNRLRCPRSERYSLGLTLKSLWISLNLKSITQGSPTLVAYKALRARKCYMHTW